MSLNLTLEEEEEVEDQMEKQVEEDWKVRCIDNFTCTDLTNQPGASIVSPVVLCLSGVIGQVWALYYLYTLKRPHHSRTVFFTLLSTLIWTDLVGKLLTSALPIAAYVKGGWIGGKTSCLAHGFVMTLTSLATHLLVSTMAVERLLGTTQTYFYNKTITTTRTRVLLAILLGGATAFCCLPFLGVGRYQLQYPGSWCYLDIHLISSSSSHSSPSSSTFSNSSSSLTFISNSSSSSFSSFFPISPLKHLIFTNFFGVITISCLVVIVACNLVVMWVLVEKTLARRGKCEGVVRCLRGCRGETFRHHLVAPRRSSTHRELETQMVAVVLVITVAFVISWSPIDVRLFLNQLWPHYTVQDHYKDLLAVRFSSINQIVDPWTYIISRKMFRPLRWVRSSVFGSVLSGRDRSGRDQLSEGSLRTSTRDPSHRSPITAGEAKKRLLKCTPLVMAALNIGEMVQAPFLMDTTTTTTTTTPPSSITTTTTSTILNSIITTTTTTTAMSCAKGTGDTLTNTGVCLPCNAINGHETTSFTVKRF